MNDDCHCIYHFCFVYNKTTNVIITFFFHSILENYILKDSASQCNEMLNERKHNLILEMNKRKVKNNRAWIKLFI